MDIKRLLFSVAVGYAVVTLLGLLAKTVVEFIWDIHYELHWLTTMPLLALLFGYWIYKK